MQKIHVSTMYGAPAHDGDYVLVNYIRGYKFNTSVETVYGKVHDDLIYTGILDYNGTRIHKKKAVCVWDSAAIPEDVKAMIEIDIALGKPQNHA